MRSKRWRGRDPPLTSGGYCQPLPSKPDVAMISVLRSTAKRLAQKLLGQSDLRGFVRKRKLSLSKKIYRRPIAVAELRQQLIDLGVTPGRTLWVQSSWNEFFNVPLRPSEMIDLMRDLLGPNGTLAMPAFPIDQDPTKVFMVDRAPVYTGLLCEVFRRTPEVQRSIHLGSSVCAIGPNTEFLIKDHHLTAMPWGKDSPFCRLMELDARMLGLGAGFNFMTPLHAVECLLYDEVPFFRQRVRRHDPLSLEAGQWRDRRARIHEPDRRHPPRPAAPAFRVGHLRRCANLEFERYWPRMLNPSSSMRSRSAARESRCTSSRFRTRSFSLLNRPVR